MAVRVNGTLYFLHTDHLGSTTLLTDQSQQVVGRLGYRPYGDTRYAMGNLPTNRHFTGQRWDSGLALYDYRARYYDPLLGRFLSADPVVPEPGNPQALNRYVYVLNNPLRYTDPSGHATCVDENCHLLAPPGSPRPFLRVPAPRAIAFIHREMICNAQSRIASTIATANAIAQVPFCPGCVIGGKTLAYTLWTSQVMDARIKRHVGPLAPLLGNWDHKPILLGEKSPVPEILDEKHKPYGYSTVGSRLYFYDIWSNIHYGYVGRASSFSQPALTGGAGVEQIGSDLYNRQWPHQAPGADNWLASWDQLSDNAAIQIGIRLWNQYGLAIKPADLYLAVLEEPRLATLPIGGAP